MRLVGVASFLPNGNLDVSDLVTRNANATQVVPMVEGVHDDKMPQISFENPTDVGLAHSNQICSDF